MAKPTPASPVSSSRRAVLLARNRALGSLWELFLITAVASLLGIRGVLALSGFPKLGGGGFHIAHMLWGGLFMLLSLLLLLGFIGRLGLYLGAFLGGVGFGTFIDELGKFITSDNNYFFKPAIAIIYVLFILLFLLSRALELRRRFSDRELLANAFDAARDATLYHRRPGDITGLLTYLRARSADDPLLVGLRDTLAGAEKRPPLAPDFVLKVQSWITNGYSALVSSRRLNSAILTLFVVYAVVVVIAIVVATVESRGMIHFDVDQSTVDYAGIAGSNTMTTLLIVVGIWRLPKSRLAALRWFDRAVVLDLLLAQVFNFYQAQFGALIGTGIDVLILLLVRGMMRVEELQS